MNCKKILTCILILGSLILAGCGQTETDKQNQKNVLPKTNMSQENTSTGAKKPNIATVDLDKVNKVIKDKDTEIKKLTEELNYYKSYVKEVTTTLVPEKMTELINKEWEYSLSINKINFPTNGILEVSDSTFNIVLSENRVKYSVLPDTESLKGKIQGELNSNMKFDTIVKIDTTQSIDKINSSITYSFKDVPKNTVIKLNLNELLVKKLGMEKSELEIRVK